MRSRFGVVWFGLVVRFVAFVASFSRSPLFVLVLVLCPSFHGPWHLGKAGTACAHSTQSLDYSSTRKAAGVSSWDASIRRVIRWLFCFPTVGKIRMLCMRPFLGFGARCEVRIVRRELTDGGVAFAPEKSTHSGRPPFRG